MPHPIPRRLMSTTAAVVLSIGVGPSAAQRKQGAIHLNSSPRGVFSVEHSLRLEGSPR